jgi:hypothetical protein
MESVPFGDDPTTLPQLQPIDVNPRVESSLALLYTQVESRPMHLTLTGV